MTQTHDHHSEHGHASHDEHGNHDHAGHVHGSRGHGRDAGERPMVTLHADLTPGTDRRQALSGIHARLRAQLDIEHVTVQIEEDGPCETPGCGPQ